MRNPKRRGEIVEIAFLHTVANMGFAVTKPYGDSEPCDFIVDSGNRLWRVQVKCTTSFCHGAYQLNAHHFTRRPEPKTEYTPKQIDILAAYILPTGAWYIVPVRAFSPHTSLMLYPHKPGHNGKYEHFRDVWFLVACRRNGEP